jgi:hypothetical protein
MIYGNDDLCGQILEYRKRMYPDYEQLEAQNGLAISTQEIQILFFRGPNTGLMNILREGTIGPDEMGQHLPLDRAVYYDQHDLAWVISRRRRKYRDAR